MDLQTDPRRTAVTQTDGPMCIVAGPGSGKTFTLVSRVVHLVTEQGVPPGEILMLTFTRKAAKELLTRISTALHAVLPDCDVGEMYIGTFHEVCLRLLHEYAAEAGLGKDCSQLDEFDQKYLIAENFYRFTGIAGFEAVYPKTRVNRDGSQTALGKWNRVGTMVSHINKLNDEMIDPAALAADGDPRVQTVGRVLAVYNGLLQERNCLDFARMQTELVRLLRSRPDILEELQRRFRYLLVDEYQDTSTIQEQLVFLLGGEAENICVVGDDEQSLYRFRGATVQNVIDFPRKTRHPCAQVVLEENFRSNPEIVSFFRRWIDSYPEWGNCRVQKRITAARAGRCEGRTVLRCSGGDEEGWHRHVAESIRALLERGVITDLNQVAFLSSSVRNKRVQDLSAYLEARGIPVYSPRSGMFFLRDEVRAMIGCLILAFPDYDACLQSGEFKNKYNLPRAAARDYLPYLRDCRSYARELAAADVAGLGDFLARCRQRHTRDGLRYGQALEYAYSGLMYRLLAFLPFSEHLSEPLTSPLPRTMPARNLSRLLSLAAAYESLHRITAITQRDFYLAEPIERFFNSYLYMRWSGGMDEYEDETETAPSGCVSFMTIHQSKGMEFPVVFADPVKPPPRPGRPELIDEILDRHMRRQRLEPRDNIPYLDYYRLYYVAFSRAQDLLVITCREKEDGGCPNAYLEPLYRELPDFSALPWEEIRSAPLKTAELKQTYSFTAHVAVYDGCPRQYKFFRELALPQTSILPAIFGTLVHETLEDIHREAVNGRGDAITEDRVRLWLDSNYQTLRQSENLTLRPSEMERAFRQVMRYVRRAKRNWAAVQYAEKEINLIRPGCDYIIQGKIDLIRGDGDSYQICDFKSKKRPRDPDDRELERYRRQLMVYARLVEQKLKKPVSAACLYYTDEEELEPMLRFPADQSALDRTLDDFDRTVRRIQARDFEHGSADEVRCRGCDMRFYCRRQ